VTVGYFDHTEELPTEGVADKAVNEKVDAGVENTHGVGDMSQAANPGRRQEILIGVVFLQVYAHDDGVQVWELPHINDDARRVAAAESDDDAKKNDEKIKFWSPSGSKTLNL